MNPAQRAEHQFDRAKALGLDGPTETMVAEAIIEAESDIWLECDIALRDVGLRQAADYLDKFVSRKLKGEQDT